MSGSMVRRDLTAGVASRLTRRPRPKQLRALRPCATLSLNTSHSAQQTTSRRHYRSFPGHIPWASAAHLSTLSIWVRRPMIDVIVLARGWHRQLRWATSTIAVQHRLTQRCRALRRRGGGSRACRRGGGCRARPGGTGSGPPSAACERGTTVAEGGVNHASEGQRQSAPLAAPYTRIERKVFNARQGRLELDPPVRVLLAPRDPRVPLDPRPEPIHPVERAREREADADKPSLGGALSNLVRRGRGERADLCRVEPDEHVVEEVDGVPELAPDRRQLEERVRNVERLERRLQVLKRLADTHH